MILKQSCDYYLFGGDTPDESQKEREKGTDIAGLVPRLTLSVHIIYSHDLCPPPPRIYTNFTPPLCAHNKFGHKRCALGERTRLAAASVKKLVTQCHKKTGYLHGIRAKNNENADQQISWLKTQSYNIMKNQPKKYLTARTMDIKIADCLSENNHVYVRVTFGVSTVKRGIGHSQWCANG